MRVWRRMIRLGASMALALGLLGCSNGTGPEGTGHVVVSLGRAAGGAITSAAINAPTFDVVPIQSIGSFDVEVTAIEVHRVGADGGESSGQGDAADGDASDSWIRIDLTPAGEGEVDLMSVPETEDVTSGFQVALDAVPAGTYNLMRLFFDGVALSLLEDTVIDGVLFEANTDLPLDIRVPSGDQTGFLVQTGSFEVPDGGTAGILITFDAETSLKNVTTNANGISITPVLKAEVEVTLAPPPEGS